MSLERRKMADMTNMEAVDNIPKDETEEEAALSDLSARFKAKKTRSKIQRGRTYYDEDCYYAAIMGRFDLEENEAKGYKYAEIDFDESTNRFKEELRKRNEEKRKKKEANEKIKAQRRKQLEWERAQIELQKDDTLVFSEVGDTTVEESISESKRESIVDSRKESIVDSKRESIVESTRESIVDSRRESIADSRNDSIAESIIESIIDFSKESIEESRNESIGDSRNESIADSRKESIGESRNESIGDSRKQSIGESRNESMIEADSLTMIAELTVTEESDCSIIHVHQIDKEEINIGAVLAKPKIRNPQNRLSLTPGVRRSKRIRVPRLASHLNQRIEYETLEDGTRQVKGVTEVFIHDVEQIKFNSVNPILTDEKRRLQIKQAGKRRELAYAMHPHSKKSKIRNLRARQRRGFDLSIGESELNSSNNE